MRWFISLTFTTMWLMAVITGHDLGGAAHLLVLAAITIVFTGRRGGHREVTRPRLR